MKYYRTESEAMKLRWMPHWKKSTPCDPDPEPSRNQHRGKAIIEVLRRLPPEAVERLKEAEPFHWLIPSTGELGSVVDHRLTFDDFGNRYAKVLYLSPRLERLGYVSVVAVVAHELAHIVLTSECPPVPSYDAYWDAEDAADELAGLWGYSKEIKRHFQLHRRARRVT